MTKQEMSLERWLDCNTKTMMLESQTDLISTIKRICREAVKHAKIKTTDSEITKAKWMID